VSQVKLEPSPAPLAVSVERASGGKCERCWTFSERIAPGTEGVCERCTEVLARQ